MVITKFIIENDLSGSSEKLLKYFDLFFEEISSYTDFNDHWILKSQNKKITSNEFKSLADNLRKEISDSAVNGVINGDLQSNLKENSVLSANIETIQSDLEDGDSLEFSDSIIVDGDQIIITFSDPACWLEDYENGGQIKISAADKAELWKKGIEEDIFFLTQIKDNDGGYSEDVNNILGLD
jgi:hypothetical protein